MAQNVMAYTYTTGTAAASTAAASACASAAVFFRICKGTAMTAVSIFVFMLLVVCLLVRRELLFSVSVVIAAAVSLICVLLASHTCPAHEPRAL